MQDSLEDFVRIASNIKSFEDAYSSGTQSVDQKKLAEDYALKVVEFLMDGKLQPQIFLKSLNFINQEHYQDVVEERVLTNLCGYALCGKRLPSMPNKNFHISTKVNKVYDISERKNFCSNYCYKASDFIKKQIETGPLWSRRPEDFPKFILLKKTEITNPGVEVDYGIAKIIVEPTFTSVTSFTEASLDEAGELEKTPVFDMPKSDFNIKPILKKRTTNNVNLNAQERQIFDGPTGNRKQKNTKLIGVQQLNRLNNDELIKNKAQNLSGNLKVEKHGTQLLKKMDTIMESDGVTNVSSEDAANSFQNHDYDGVDTTHINTANIDKSEEETSIKIKSESKKKKVSFQLKDDLTENASTSSEDQIVDINFLKAQFNKFGIQLKHEIMNREFERDFVNMKYRNSVEVTADAEDIKTGTKQVDAEEVYTGTTETVVEKIEDNAQKIAADLEKVKIYNKKTEINVEKIEGNVEKVKIIGINAQKVEGDAEKIGKLTQVLQKVNESKIKKEDCAILLESNISAEPARFTSSALKANQSDFVVKESKAQSSIPSTSKEKVCREASKYVQKSKVLKHQKKQPEVKPIISPIIVTSLLPSRSDGNEQNFSENIVPAAAVEQTVQKSMQEIPKYAQRVVNLMKKPGEDPNLKTVISKVRKINTDHHKKSAAEAKNDDDISAVLEKLKNKRGSKTYSPVLIDTVSNPEHKIARPSLVKSKPRKEEITVTLEKLKTCIPQWLTLETYVLLHGEEKVKTVLNEEVIDGYFEMLHVADLEMNQQARYMGICKKLQLRELAEDKFDGAVISGTHGSLKPLPDYARLKEQGRDMNVKVKAFFSGAVYEKQDTNFPTNEESQEGVPSVLPTVDANSQNATRQTIFINCVNRHIQNHVYELDLNESTVADIQAMIKSFKLERNNIVFKPSVWIIIALVLIFMLSVGNEELKKKLALPEAVNYRNTILSKCAESELFFEQMLHLIENVDVYVKNYITSK